MSSMSKVVLHCFCFLAIVYAKQSSGAIANQFNQFALRPDSAKGSHHNPANEWMKLGSKSEAAFASLTEVLGQVFESVKGVASELHPSVKGADSEHMAAAVLSLLALVAPCLIIMFVLLAWAARNGMRYLQDDGFQKLPLPQDDEDDEAEEASLEPLVRWRNRHSPTPLSPVWLTMQLFVCALVLYAGSEYLIFVVKGPFARRFVCTDTGLDTPSADLTPMVRETLRGFCWEGYRWVGVNRGEAELLLLGLERALIETSKNGAKGEVVELGAALGETTLWTSRFLDLYAKATGEPRRGHRVYDAFEGAGFPPCVDDKDGVTCKRWWMRSSIFRHTLNFFLSDRRWLLTFLLRSQGATQPDLVQKGYFSANPPEVYPEHVAFAMFDSDMYESILDSFKQVYPKMSPGGVAFVHDVDRSCCGGPRLAVNSYLLDKHTLLNKPSDEPTGFFTWEGKRPFVTWATTGPSFCKSGNCSAPYPVTGWKWNTAEANKGPQTE